jgi:hypothetical protein
VQFYSIQSSDSAEERMPFEFITLELILQTVCKTLESRYEIYTQSLAPLLQLYTEAADSDMTNNSNTNSADSSSTAPIVFNPATGSTLMHLLQLKNGLTSFEVVLVETSSAMRDVLYSDEDMSSMYLTMKKLGQIQHTAQHAEVEVLLETYLRKVDELENEVKTNVKSISLTEEYIQIRLDTVRNAIMKLELLISIFTFSVAASALIAGVFGMNVKNHLESSPYGMWLIGGGLLAASAIIARKLLRLTARHKIDLFHVEPDEPKLKLPATNLTSKKFRSKAANSMYSTGLSKAYSGSTAALNKMNSMNSSSLSAERELEQWREQSKKEYARKPQ